MKIALVGLFFCTACMLSLKVAMTLGFYPFDILLQIERVPLWFCCCCCCWSYTTFSICSVCFSNWRLLLHSESSVCTFVRETVAKITCTYSFQFIAKSLKRCCHFGASLSVCVYFFACLLIAQLCNNATCPILLKSTCTSAEERIFCTKKLAIVWWQNVKPIAINNEESLWRRNHLCFEYVRTW